MGERPQVPADLARRLGSRRDERQRKRLNEATSDSVFRRETFTLPREEARAKAGEWFDHWPKAAYMTEVEFWRELADGRIEFTMRRLPSAD